MRDTRRYHRVRSTRLRSLSIGIGLLIATVAQAHENHPGDGGVATHEERDTAPSLSQRAAMLGKVAAEGVGVNPGFRLTSDDQAAVLGRWESPMDWPLVGVFNSLLSDGRVLSFDAAIYEDDTIPDTTAERDFTRATVWDPISGTHERVNAETGYELFCSGFASLPDGRLFVAAGNKGPSNLSIPQTHLFNPDVNAWMETQTMAAARWYPSVTPLANGESLITGGRVGRSEVRGTDGRLRSLTGVDQERWENSDYPWLQTAPDGRVAFLGPHPKLGLASTRGAGDWADTVVRDNNFRTYGSYAMYDIGKVLVSGGGRESSAYSQQSAVLLDLVNSTATPTTPMTYRRRQHDLTILADGSVLASGGFASNVSLVDLDSAVYTSELWNPETRRWTPVASEAFARQYHSSTLLLPDGRVLSTGGGVCGDCNDAGYYMKNAQLYTPPYLFDPDRPGELAQRPVISSSPSTVNYDTAFSIRTADASDIDRAALIRIGSATHSQNMEQRYVPLDISGQSAGKLTLQSPGNANIAPPGYYMLFIVNSLGVPSVSSMVKVAKPAKMPAVDQLQLANLAAPQQGASVRQSSVYPYGRPVAQRAVDGNTNGDYADGSVTHTGRDRQAWLEVDLGVQRKVDRIRLYNRTDCCSARLSMFHVLVSDKPFVATALAPNLKSPAVSDYYVERIVNGVLEIPVGRKARYVRVQLAGTGYLSLAELEVWGEGDAIETDPDGGQGGGSESGPYALSPNTLGSGALPSGYADIRFSLADGNWVRDISLPAKPRDGDEVTISSRATYTTWLNAADTNFPARRLKIRTGESYTLVYRAADRQWRLGGDLVDYLTPRSTGWRIPNRPNRVTFYDLADGDWSRWVSLPAKASGGSVITITNRATYSTWVSGANQRNGSAVLLRTGDQSAFRYHDRCGCWDPISNRSRGAGRNFSLWNTALDGLPYRLDLMAGTSR